MNDNLDANDCKNITTFYEHYFALDNIFKECFQSLVYFSMFYVLFCSIGCINVYGVLYSILYIVHYIYYISIYTYTIHKHNLRITSHHYLRLNNN